MRDVRIDNIKGLLIILTVFGHLLELLSGGTSSALYRIIYSFHMPAFIFISGYFAKWNPKKLLKFQLPLYLISQFTYLLFDQCFIGEKSLSLIGFLTPYWHLWYLLALMLYQPLVLLLSRIKGKPRIAAVIISVILSLSFPLVKADLYLLSFGRAFAFLPFFTLGYFCGHGKKCFPDLVFLVPFSILFVMTDKSVTVKVLYGSFAYSDYSEIIIRAALILFALGYISLLLHMPSKESPLSFIGKNTLPVYLIHGFIVRVLRISGARLGDTLTALLLSALLCSALANIRCENIRKTVDSILKKVYNIIKNDWRLFIWILRQRSKNSSKRSRVIRTSRQNSAKPPSRLSRS